MSNRDSPSPHPSDRSSRSDPPERGEREKSAMPVFDRILSERQPETPEESPLEPELPIVDPHHHLRDRPGHLYLLPELLRDIAGGHDIRATVAVECTAMY